MNKFSGIDLHSNNSVVAVSDEADRIVYQRRLPNDPIQIRAALAPHREELVGVVIEATFNSYWLVDELMKDGYCVHLANPAAIRQYDGLKYSGDFADAAYLAQLLRLGLLPEGYIYPAQERQVRDLSRKRMQLVQCRTPRSWRSRTCSHARQVGRCRANGSSVWMRRRSADSVLRPM